MSEELPPHEPQVPPAPGADDDFPEVRRRLWDLEWRLRRESGALTEKLADVFRSVMQAPGWSGEAIAEGLLPALIDLKQRVQQIEAREAEGSAAHDPAHLALVERVEVLERLVEEGVAAQRAQLGRLHGLVDRLSERLAAVEDWAGRLAALEFQAERTRTLATGLERAERAIADLERTAREDISRFGTELATQQQAQAETAESLASLASKLAELEAAAEQQAERLAAHEATVTDLRGQSEAVEADRKGSGVRLSHAEERLERLEQAVGSTTDELATHLERLATSVEQIGQELAEKVSSAQFASSSLAMANQHTAIKELRAQVKKLASGADALEAKLAEVGIVLPSS